MLLLARVQMAQGADPYGAALDKRFQTEPAAPRGPDPGVAALEEGLKKQIRELSHRPEPVSQTQEVKETEPWLILASLLITALVLGIVSLVGLREWNQWLDREAAKRLNSLAADPLMVEFLRALHEDAQASTAQPEEAKPGSEAALESSPGQTLPARDPAVLVLEYVAALRADFQKLSRASDNDARQKILGELLKHADLIKQCSTPNAFRSVRLLASALHGLLNQLSLKAANVTSSPVRTAAAAVDLLEFLCTQPSRADLITSPPVQLLAVDDDAISRRAVSLALKKAFDEPDLAPEGRIALALARQRPYDVIFLDIEMPGMDGFELYSKIRETAPNCSTPIVFVTGHTDFDSRAKSAMLGANELIAKPFLAFEITVKALTLVLKGRHAREMAPVTTSQKEQSPFDTSARTGPLSAKQDRQPARV
jgi:CheY-like chemotaxis protein